MNQSANIYIYNFLKSNSASYNADDSFLMSRIINFNNHHYLKGIPQAELASKLYNLFQMSNSSFWKNVDRVCFATREYSSNKLKIISSFQNENVKSSILNPGYYCYVKENSSIFKIQPGEIRCYSDIQNIIDSFQEAKEIPQRSIHLLYLSGIQSGLTIPLVVDENIQGFLFLNSTKIDLFSEIRDQNYSALCLLQTIFSQLLSKFQAQYTKRSHSKYLENITNANTITQSLLENELKEALENYFKTNNFSLKFTSKIDEQYLISPRIIGHHILNALDQVEFKDLKKEIKINITSKSETEIIIDISFDNHTPIKYLKNPREIELPNSHLTSLETCMILTIEAELNRDKLKYSIV